LPTRLKRATVSHVCSNWSAPFGSYSGALQMCNTIGKQGLHHTYNGFECSTRLKHAIVFDPWRAPGFESDRSAPSSSYPRRTPDFQRDKSAPWFSARGALRNSEALGARHFVHILERSGCVAPSGNKVDTTLTLVLNICVYIT
jgi:hypothetical protein